MIYVSTRYSRRARCRSVFRAWPFLGIVIATLSSDARAGDFDPSTLYLGWQRDPTRTMTVHWHHDWRQGYRDPVIEVRTAGHGDWKVVWGNSHPAPFSDKIVNVVEIADLAPDTEYEFRFGKIRSASSGFVLIADSPQYRFSTLPSTLTKPLKFVVGGDIYSTLIGGPDVQATRERLEVIDNMNRQAAATNPAFVVIGGDIAYDNGRPTSAARWDDFLALWKKGMRTPDGRIIPTIAVIGNHETHAEAYERASWPHPVQTPNRAPFFYSFFSFPGRPGYNALDAGDYLSIIALDSGHTAPIAGRQAEWLAHSLKKRETVRFVVPVYHVPAYPSGRDPEGEVSQEIRQHWTPWFEKFNVRFVFENHDHLYKRTKPVRAGQVDASGVYYLGDGAWGVRGSVRDAAEETSHLAALRKRWYIERLEKRNHVIVVTLENRQASFQALDHRGIVFDEFTIRP